MEIFRKDILEGNYIYPQDLIRLKPTKHFMGRLEERGLELNCIPTIVRVTRNNIQSAKCEDGKHLHSVVIRLDYKKDTYLYLCFNPFDAALKTLWFRKKFNYESSDRRKPDIISIRQTDGDDRGRDQVCGSP